MSNYFKRVLVLKEVKKGYADGQEPLSAILKAESASIKGIRLNLAPVNLNLPNENLKLAIFSDEMCILPFENEQLAVIDLSLSISAGIFYNDELLCFGSGGINPLSKNDFVNAYNLSLNNSLKISSENVQQGIYDDERISEINYYDDRAVGEGLYGTKKFFNSHDEIERGNQAQKEEIEFNEAVIKNAPNSFTGKKSHNDLSSPYYETVREQLKSVFSNGTSENGLRDVIPHSQWVRINYSIDKYYVVGIINKTDSPYYICYGIPSTYGNPPEKFKGYASFIPSSLFNLNGDGFYIMFQSALSGECIVPKIDIFGL